MCPIRTRLNGVGMSPSLFQLLTISVLTPLLFKEKNQEQVPQICSRAGQHVNKEQKEKGGEEMREQIAANKLPDQPQSISRHLINRATRRSRIYSEWQHITMVPFAVVLQARNILEWSCHVAFIQSLSSHGCQIRIKASGCMCHHIILLLLLCCYTPLHSL